VFADKLGCKLEEASPWKDDYFGHFFTIALTETDLKRMRELVAKYGDRMQPHLVDAIKGTMTDGGSVTTRALQTRRAATHREGSLDSDFSQLITVDSSQLIIILMFQTHRSIDGFASRR
jgi:hypothetical protein